jgi:hypothetical protein
VSQPRSGARGATHTLVQGAAMAALRTSVNFALSTETTWDICLQATAQSAQKFTTTRRSPALVVCARARPLKGGGRDGGARRGRATRATHQLLELGVRGDLDGHRCRGLCLRLYSYVLTVQLYGRHHCPTESRTWGQFLLHVYLSTATYG